MRKLVMLFIIIAVVSFGSVYASNSITYFYGESIEITDSNIDILSNEVTIDVINSKVTNVVLLKNTSDKEIATTIVIPIENKELSVSANNVEILVDGSKVEYEKNNDGEYVVNTEIPLGSGQKLEISYHTDNDLNRAKVIKYNMENFKGRIVGKVKVNIVIDEKNIPLVEKIYPGHFEFDEETNTISVEYYQYEVTTITKEVIVQKETFHNLLYGRENELSEQDRRIVKAWADGNIDAIKEEKYWKYSTMRNIVYYIDRDNPFFWLIDEYGDLIYYLCGKWYLKGEVDSDWESSLDHSFALNGKTICIDFVETEDVDLYEVNSEVLYEIPWDEVSRICEENNLDGKTAEKIFKEYYTGKYDFSTYMVMEEDRESYVFCNYKYDLKPERYFLKVIGAWAARFGERLIFVGEGINGEKLGATEEEIVKYNNSINADMYMRVMIYDNPLEKNQHVVGYYNDENKEIADAYRYGSSQLKLLSNNYIKNNSEIPTIGHFAFHRIKVNGYYSVDYIESYTDGFPNGVYEALETSAAKDLIAKNRTKNQTIKTNVENDIKNLVIINPDQTIWEDVSEEKTNGENISSYETPILVEESSSHIANLDKDDYIIISCFIVGICICVIVLKVKNKKK